MHKARSNWPSGIIAGVMGSLLFISSVIGQVPGATPDTVKLRILDIIPEPVPTFSVEILVSLDSALSGGVLGFSWSDTANWRYDSVQFGPGLLAWPIHLSTPVALANSIGKVLIGGADFGFAPFPPGPDQPWATIFFSLKSGGSISDTPVVIDSSFVPPGGDFVLIYNGSGTVVFPNFIGPLTINIGSLFNDTDEDGIGCAGGAGNALQFDGNDEVVIPHDTSLSFAVGANFTMELWMNPSDTSGIIHIMGKRISAATQCENVEYQLALDDGQPTSLQFGTSPSNLNIKLYSTSFVTPGTWVHVAVTYDGTTLRMYLDGVLNASRVDPFGQPNLADLKIGASANCGNSFEGQIDEVRIWKLTRSASDIAQHYNQTVNPSAPGLVGYWNFDEDISDQNVIDVSGSSNNGTLGFNNGIGGDDPLRVLSTVPIVGGPTCVRIVDLDIKPRSCPNPLNVNNKGVLP
ncbi:MAG: LamG domain-containing protein, partial [candidate division Zixibacteria bacterium]|nr:LamG domain-containing protein [candidate division Zixibacteria bacterium]